MRYSKFKSLFFAFKLSKLNLNCQNLHYFVVDFLGIAGLTFPKSLVKIHLFFDIRCSLPSVSWQVGNAFGVWETCMVSQRLLRAV